jgi:hypothetical protein
MPLDRTWYNTLVDDDGSGLTGSIWDKADVNALMNAIDNAQVGASMSYGGGYVMPVNSVMTAIGFATTIYDPLALYNAAAQAFVVPSNGLYLVTSNIGWAAGPGGVRTSTLMFAPTGDWLLAPVSIAGSAALPPNIRIVYSAFLTAGQQLQVGVTTDVACALGPSQFSLHRCY